MRYVLSNACWRKARTGERKRQRKRKGEKEIKTKGRTRKVSGRTNGQKGAFII